MKTDVHLQRDVLDELDWEPSLDAAQIGVTVHEAVVTLTGHVPTYSEKHMAEQCAKRVHGVKGVANEIEVRPAEIHVRDDEDLAAAAVHALHWDVKIPDQRLQVTVEDGWITLDGRVQANFERAAADHTVRHLVGARGMTNRISVEPAELSDEIKSRIEAAFRRSAVLDSQRIDVSTEGRCVTLTGDVHSHAELEEAERIAWSARGVDQVVNCITLTPWGAGPAEEWGY